MSGADHAAALGGAGEIAGGQAFLQRAMRTRGVRAGLAPSSNQQCRRRFSSRFRRVARALHPGAVELLQELSPRFKLASLSNTNDCIGNGSSESGICPRSSTRLPLVFDGRLKPDADYFEHVLDTLASRRNVRYSSMTRVNVAAAAGWHRRATRRRPCGRAQRTRRTPVSIATDRPQATKQALSSALEHRERGARRDEHAAERLFIARMCPGHASRNTRAANT